MNFHKQEKKLDTVHPEWEQHAQASLFHRNKLIYMKYTIKPEKSAKASAENLRISRKDAVKICRIIQMKPLKNVKRFLNSLSNKTIHVDGKYYTNAANAVSELINSCEKNAESLGLNTGRLWVHASAHMGAVMRRRRRKAGFGSRIKSTNLELILIEKPEKEVSKKLKKKQSKEASTKPQPITTNTTKEPSHTTKETKKSEPASQPTKEKSKQPFPDNPTVIKGENK